MCNADIEVINFVNLVSGEEREREREGGGGGVGEEKNYTNYSTGNKLACNG